MRNPRLLSPVAGGGVANALGSVFRTQKINIGTMVYASGQTTPLDIPRGLLLKSLKVRLSGTITVAGGPLTSYNSETPLPLMQRIELTADGRKPFFSIDGRSLYRQNHFMRGKAQELVGFGNVANGTYAFSAYVTLDSEALRHAYPIDSYLDTRLYDNLQLRITWAAGSTLASLGGGTITVNAGTVAVVQGEYTAAGFEFVKFNKLVLNDEIPVVAASTALRLPVPRNGLLSSVLIRADIDNVVSDTLINNVTLRSENTVMHGDHLEWNTLRASNTAEFQLDNGANGAPVSGYGFHFLTEDAMISSCIDTTALNVLDLVFDVALPAGTTRLIRVSYTYFEPISR